MTGAGFVDAAAFDEFFDPVAQVGGADARAVAAEEEGGLMAAAAATLVRAHIHEINQ
jgi:hypothetical protein